MFVVAGEATNSPLGYSISDLHETGTANANPDFALAGAAVFDGDKRSC